MPYSKHSELPKGVQNNLPEHAQEIYMKAFNNAWDQYKDPKKRQNPKDDRESTAHRVAWAAVEKSGYHKDEDGNWVKEDT